MRFTTDALVIKEMKVGESDRLVTLLTKEYGVIKAFAAGAKNIKSKKAAATGLLSYSSVTILKKNDTYKIYEATPIKIFFGAGSDILHLALSQYFCELSLVLAPGEDDCEEFLRIILNSLHFLTAEKRNCELIKAITELRIASLTGYMPDLVACENCSEFEADVMYFRVSDGHIICGNCKNEVGLIPIDRTCLTAMRHIVYSKLNSLYSFDIPDEAAKRLSALTGKYIITQTDHNFKTLDFYNNIK